MTKHLITWLAAAWLIAGHAPGWASDPIIQTRFTADPAPLVSGATGTHDLFLVFRGPPDPPLFNFDSWRFVERKKK